jgi:hypothetical protein
MVGMMVTVEIVEPGVLTGFGPENAAAAALE